MPRVELHQRRIRRRDFLYGIAGLGTLGLTTSCGQPPPPGERATATPTTQAIVEIPKTKEGEADYRQGDILTNGTDFFELRGGVRFLLHKGINEYSRRTRAGEFGARLAFVSQKTIDGIPLGEIPRYPLTDMTQMKKANRSLDGGGQKITFFLGFANTLGTHWEGVSDGGGVFGKIQQRVLKDMGWGIEDFLFDTHGTMGKEGFGFAATMRDINQNALYGMATFQRTKEFVLERNNVFGFSIGGLIALLALENHLDNVNNIFLLDSPILGLPPTGINTTIGVFLSQVYGDKVMGQLMDLWENEDHHQRIRRIVAKIRREKKGFYTWGVEGSFIPTASSVLEGTTEAVDGIRINPILARNAFITDPRITHGRLLDPQEAPQHAECIKRIIKRNVT